MDKTWLWFGIGMVVLVPIFLVVWGPLWHENWYEDVERFKQHLRKRKH
jgi:hypothetical protein